MGNLPTIVNILRNLLALIEQAEKSLVDVDVQLLSSLSYFLETLRSGDDLLVLYIHLKVLLQVVRGTLRIDSLQIIVIIQLPKDYGDIWLNNDRRTLAVYLAMGSTKSCKRLVKDAVTRYHRVAYAF